MEPNKKDLPAQAGNNIPEPHLVKTFAEDMAGAIGDNQEGFVKKIIHEEEENEAEKIRQSRGSKENKFFLFMGGMLILGAIGLIGFSFLENEAATMPVDKPFTPLIFTDKSVFVEVGGLDKLKIIEAINTTVTEANLKSGEVEGIYITENKKVIGLRRFLALTKNTFVVPTPIVGQADFVSDSFLIGVSNNNVAIEGGAAPELSKDFFILIRTSSMTDVFNSLRNWEEKMFTDLYGFFGITLSPATEILLTKDFEDGIIENKNARILYSEGDPENNKDIAMMYVFANNNSVVITKSPFTAREVILRLASPK